MLPGWPSRALNLANNVISILIIIILIFSILIIVIINGNQFYIKPPVFYLGSCEMTGYSSNQRDMLVSLPCSCNSSSTPFFRCSRFVRFFSLSFSISSSFSSSRLWSSKATSPW